MSSILCFTPASRHRSHVFASVVHSSCNVLLGFASTQSCYYSWFALRHSAFVILCLVVSSQYIVSPPRISPPPFIQPFGLLRNYIVIPRLCRCVPKDPSETDFDSIPLWCTRKRLPNAKAEGWTNFVRASALLNLMFIHSHTTSETRELQST